MIRQRGSTVLLVAVLAVSVVLLGWSVMSTWHASQSTNAATGAIDSAAAENFPPKLDSKEAKASLFYPVMKSRGPQPGGKLVAKPLRGDARVPEVR
jgi:hypothetical protein